MTTKAIKTTTIGTTHDMAMDTLKEWRFINQHGWDRWDDLVAQNGFDPDKERWRLFTSTGMTLSRDDLNLKLAREIGEEREKAQNTLRAERGRLFLKVPSTAERKRRQQKARRTRARHERLRRRGYAAFSKDEAVNYMFAIVSSVRQFEAIPLLDRVTLLQRRGHKRRVNIIRDGRQPKLLTYQEPT